MSRTKVFLIEGHQMIREMLSKQISEQRSLKFTGSDGGIRGALKAVRQLKPDIILLDMQLKNGVSEAGVRQIRKLFPDINLICLSLRAQPPVAKQMIRLGVKAYITKNSPLSELFVAINKVSEGETYICKEIKGSNGRKPFTVRPQKSKFDMLTNRERDVLDRVYKGFSTKEIAEKLGMAVKTAEVHRHNILKKLNIKNSYQLIHMMHKNFTI